MKIIKKKDERAINEFLATAHLYQAKDQPAIRYDAENVIFLHLPDEAYLSPAMAAETVHATVRTLKERLVEHEADLRQYAWRMDKKRARKVELENDIEELNGIISDAADEIAGLEKGTSALSTKEAKADAGKREERKQLEVTKNEKSTLRAQHISKRDQAQNELKEVNEQLSNSNEHIEVTLKKVEDTKSDIDAALAFASDLETGAWSIYRNELKTK